MTAEFGVDDRGWYLGLRPGDTVLFQTSDMAEVSEATVGDVPEDGIYVLDVFFEDEAYEDCRASSLCHRMGRYDASQWWIEVDGTGISSVLSRSGQ